MLHYAENEVPEMKDINRYVKIDHAACWRNIGTELGLSCGRLDIIEADEPNKCEVRFQNMIKLWIQLNGHNATWKVLEVALTNVNRQIMSLDHVDDVYGMTKEKLHI